MKPIPENDSKDGGAVPAGTTENHRVRIESESLALWFLRLNGFLTIPNFIVHPETGDGGQGTDVDVLGVRFPYRAENRVRPMRDHELFAKETRLQVVLSEVKTNQCKLNGPWTTRNLENLQKVICATGFCPVEQADDIAHYLYGAGSWEDSSVLVRILCFGREHNRGLAKDFPSVPQLLWEKDVLPFIYQRFFDYHLEKRLHPQWDRPGRLIARTAMTCRDSLDSFVAAIEVVEPQVAELTN